MWSIRFLTGPLNGQTFPLKPGSYVLGRSQTCELHVASPNVSKEHLKIDVTEDKILLTDLNSRNGTFVNGVKIKAHGFKSGDPISKVAAHDIFFELAPYSPPKKVVRPKPIRPQQSHGNLAHNQYPMGQHQGQPHSAHLQVANSQAPHHSQHPYPAYSQQPDLDNRGDKEDSDDVESDFFAHLGKNIQKYVDRVVLPGVYKLTEVMEFRTVIFLFMLGFIISMTALSAFPLVRLLKSSIESESQRRARTIATNLAQINRDSLESGLRNTLTVEFAQKEPGVVKAYIIEAVTGQILAPAYEQGSYPTYPFIHQGRKQEKIIVEQINDKTIGAMVPISGINTETGMRTVTAFAVVIYDMGSLAINDDKTMSLIIQTFLIALFVGAIVFFFVYKLVEFPISELNSQLDNALREGSTHLEISFLHEPFQKLLGNISSTLTRAIHGNMDAMSSRPVSSDRSFEIANTTQLIGFPAMSYNLKTQMIVAVNSPLEERLMTTQAQLVNQSLDAISDQALRLSLNDLLNRAAASTQEFHSNSLEFSGKDHLITAQAISGNEGAEFVIFVIVPQGGG